MTVLLGKMNFQSAADLLCECVPFWEIVMIQLAKIREEACFVRDLREFFRASRSRLFTAKIAKQEPQRVRRDHFRRPPLFATIAVFDIAQ
jgi:hypothetical protein